MLDLISVGKVYFNTELNDLHKVVGWLGENRLAVQKVKVTGDPIPSIFGKGYKIRSRKINQDLHIYSNDRFANQHRAVTDKDIECQMQKKFQPRKSQVKLKSTVRP